MILLTALVSALALTGLARAADTMIRRAAFDIGSTSIKCTVADVDAGTGTLIKVVDTFTGKVDFAEDLARSYDGNLSREIMDQGQAALEALRQDALKLQARQFSAVGGACFRTARNGRAYFVTLQEKLGFPCRIISKQQASLLNYHAVRLQADVPEPALLVWDIGGDSLQMTARNRDGSMTFHVDDLASVSFKNAVIRLIQGKDIAAATSPNPMDAAQVGDALRYAFAHAESSVPPAMADNLRNGLMTVIGIGGVHYHSIPETLGTQPQPFTRQEVEEALHRWTGKPDAAFASEYAATRLTNLILVLGYMRAMDIRTVTPLSTNETYGLLVCPEYW
ncbi:MAG: hypothetical protein V3571_11670 [Pseudodesulfovibrio sp.]